MMIKTNLFFLLKFEIINFFLGLKRKTNTNLKKGNLCNFFMKFKKIEV